MKRQILSLAVVVAFLCPDVVQAKIAYKVIDLGTLGAYASSSAKSINDRGQIVGQADAWLMCYATLFDPTGAGNNIGLGTLGFLSSAAFSINNAGQIVGYATNSQGHSRATLFDSTGAGNNIDLGTCGGRSSRAYCINDAGQIVGNANLPEYEWTVARATLFDPTGGRQQHRPGHGRRLSIQLGQFHQRRWPDRRIGL